MHKNGYRHRTGSLWIKYRLRHFRPQASARERASSCMPPSSNRTNGKASSNEGREFFEASPTVLWRQRSRQRRGDRPPAGPRSADRAASSESTSARTARVWLPSASKATACRAQESIHFGSGPRRKEIAAARMLMPKEIAKASLRSPMNVSTAMPWDPT